MRDRLPPRDRWSALGLAGIATAALGLALSGPVGLFAGAALCAAWFPTRFGAVALGSVLAGALLPGAVPPGPSGALVSLGLAAALSGELRDAAATRPALVAFGALALLAAGVPTLAARLPLWQTAAGATVVGAFAAYALYRYELVRLGLVEVSA